MSVSAALLAFSVVSPVFGSGCGGDYNRDGEVGSADLGSMLSAWGTSEIGYDLDGDGVVNAGDLGLLIAAWGPCQTEERCHTGSAVLMGTGSGGEVRLEYLSSDMQAPTVRPPDTHGRYGR